MKNYFYVVLSGVHASGKTSILDRLSRIDGYNILEETIDVSEENPLSLNPFERQHWMFDNMERREYEIRKQNGTFVTDRWIGDVLRYVDVFHSQQWMTQSQRDGLLRRYWYKKWTMPDLEVVFTADMKTLEDRINSRERTDEQKTQEIDLARMIKERFENYAKAHTFNRRIVLLQKFLTDSRS